MTIFDDAVAAHRSGEWERAFDLYGQALRDEPWKASHNMGVLHSALGRHVEAEAALRRALDVRPELAEARYSLAHVLLAQGRFAEAWPLFEARRLLPRLALPTGPAGVPEWVGESIESKRLLVLGEQGFGDQIMFARFHEPLRARGADVVFVCRSGLNRLIPGSFPTAIDLRRVGADFWSLGASLPLRLGVELGTAPSPLRLAIPQGEGGGVGVVTRGRPTHLNDGNRSLCDASARRLLGLGRDLSPEITGAKDFLDTAHIIGGLDLVISVDTALAHLAASMGKPTWILLPAYGTDWRWMRARSDSPWYPSVRLFRQPRPGDWDATLDEVEVALLALHPQDRAR